MEQRHTPGPWELSKHSDLISVLEDEYGIYPPPGEAGPVAVVGGEANAKLISAGPDLLAFVQMIANGGINEAGEAQIEAEARELIKKATE